MLSMWGYSGERMRAAHYAKVGAVAALAIIGSLVPALAVAARPQDPFVVAAAFPAWWSPERVEAAAQSAGAVSRSGRFNIVVVYGGADVGLRLSKNGAWAILDPSIADCISK